MKKWLNNKLNQFADATHRMSKRIEFDEESSDGRPRRHEVMVIENGQHFIKYMLPTEVVNVVLQHTRDMPHIDTSVGPLKYRDLRQVLTRGNDQQPSIEVRRGCIVFCLPPVTAIILRECLFWFTNDDVMHMNDIIFRLEALQRSTMMKKTHRRIDNDAASQRTTPSHSNPSSSLYKDQHKRRMTQYDGGIVAFPRPVPPINNTNCGIKPIISEEKHFNVNRVHINNSSIKDIKTKISSFPREIEHQPQSDPILSIQKKWNNGGGITGSTSRQIVNNNLNINTDMDNSAYSSPAWWSGSFSSPEKHKHVTQDNMLLTNINIDCNRGSFGTINSDETDAHRSKNGSINQFYNTICGGVADLNKNDDNRKFRQSNKQKNKTKILEDEHLKMKSSPPSHKSNRYNKKINSNFIKHQSSARVIEAPSSPSSSSSLDSLIIEALQRDINAIKQSNFPYNSSNNNIKNINMNYNINSFPSGISMGSAASSLYPPSVLPPVFEDGFENDGEYSTVSKGRKGNKHISKREHEFPLANNEVINFYNNHQNRSLDQHFRVPSYARLCPPPALGTNNMNNNNLFNGANNSVLTLTPNSLLAGGGSVSTAMFPSEEDPLPDVPLMLLPLLSNNTFENNIVNNNNNNNSSGVTNTSSLQEISFNKIEVTDQTNTSIKNTKDNAYNFMADNLDAQHNFFNEQLNQRKRTNSISNSLTQQMPVSKQNQIHQLQHSAIINSNIMDTNSTKEKKLDNNIVINNKRIRRRRHVCRNPSIHIPQGAMISVCSSSSSGVSDSSSSSSISEFMHPLSRGVSRDQLNNPLNQSKNFTNSPFRSPHRKQSLHHSEIIIQPQIVAAVNPRQITNTKVYNRNRRGSSSIKNKRPHAASLITNSLLSSPSTTHRKQQLIHQVNRRSSFSQLRAKKHHMLQEVQIGEEKKILSQIEFEKLAKGSGPTIVAERMVFPTLWSCVEGTNEAGAPPHQYPNFIASPSSFHVHALESLLYAASISNQEERKPLQHKVRTLWLQSFERTPSSTMLENLHMIKEPLGRMTARMAGICTALQMILENVDDLVAMDSLSHYHPHHYPFNSAPLHSTIFAQNINKITSKKSFSSSSSKSDEEESTRSGDAISTDSDSEVKKKDIIGVGSIVTSPSLISSNTSSTVEKIKKRKYRKGETNSQNNIIQHQPTSYTPQKYFYPDGTLAPNPDIENLFEHYDQEFGQLLGRVQSLANKVQSAEQHIGLKLSLARNRLVLLELAATGVALVVSLGAMLTGIFGMNLTNNLEDDEGMFKIVTSSIVGGVFLLSCVLAGMVKFIKL